MPARIVIGYIWPLNLNVETDVAEKLKIGEFLPIMEDFYTVQGEGHHTGSSAYFIRIGGCDVGCHWCDVKESWNAALHPLTNIEEVVERAKAFPSRTVVLTGGEPTGYQLSKLTERLRKEGFIIHLESAGSYDLTGSFDWICLSPKKTVPPLPAIYSKANELKVIVFNKNDLKWAVEQAKSVSSACLLYLQPEWGKRDEMMPMIIDFVKENPKWKVSLQSHKYMRIP